MQPLAYFAVRALLGWLQFVERHERAFASSTQLLVAAGAAHCWAVVYALFIGIHTRAMRYDGYHDGYTVHLPFWVSWTEYLSVCSMGIWWVAGFSTAAIRIVDDDYDALPSESRDVDVGFLLKLARAPILHRVLDLSHALSCAGLFISIILLCVAMFFMSGGITACELCLVFVSLGFALPHAAIAARRVQDSGSLQASRATAAAAAAAAEAAAVGPQLCVLLSVADSPGHAYVWQNLLYLVAAVAFVAAVAACGRSPPKSCDAALPPEPPEFAACLGLDIAASVALVLCFPHLNTWQLWVLAAFVIILFVALIFEDWRLLSVDMLDPLMVTRSDDSKQLPGQQRQRLRFLSWGLALLCGAVALWDIAMHPVQEGLWEPQDRSAEAQRDFWSTDTTLLFRYKSSVPTPTEAELLAAATEALSLEDGTAKGQNMLEPHRLLLFRVQDQLSSSRIKWKSATAEPTGRLAQLLDTDFPTFLNVTLCLHAHAEEELKKQASEKAAKRKEEGVVWDSEDEKPTAKPGSILATVGGADAQAAYLAACDAWSTKVFSAPTTSAAPAGGREEPGKPAAAAPAA